MFFKDYKDVFSHVMVIGRMSDVHDVSGLKEASGEGVEFIFLENISTFRSFFGLRKKHEESLSKLMDINDKVIVRLPGELGILAASVANKRGKKYLVEVVGCAWDALWNYGGIITKLYAPLLYFRMKQTVRKAHSVTYDTEKFLQKRYPCSANAFCLGISDVRLGVMNKQVLLKRIKKIDLLSEKIVFGTIGSLGVGYKGINVAIGALATMAKKGVHFEYRVLGEGDPGKYKKLANKYGIGDKVLFDGRLPEGSAVDHWLDQIDIYLQPSLAEALSRALIKAMSRGCPAIGSDVGGIPELLHSDAIFPSKDTEALAQIIDKFTVDKVLLIRESERNFQRVMRYKSPLLSEKRQQFFLQYKES